MSKPKKVKARVFIVDCERNDAYEHELKNHGVAHEYHGFNFYVPLCITTETATNFIMDCLRRYNRPLISIKAEKLYKAMEQNVWSFDQIEHSIEFGYHR